MRIPALLLLAVQILSAQAKRVDDLAQRNAGKTGEDWITYGLTPGETRYSPLSQINTSNVSRLGFKWSYDLGKGGGNQEATPLVWNGTIYTITNWSVVVALDARTGKELWRWDPEVNQDKVRPHVCCGIVHRGLAIYEGLIIAPIVDGRLQALDATTGKPVWEARVSWSQDNYSVTMAPRIAKGKVIIGVAGAEYPVRGYFSAFDAKTGKFLWRFYTIPGDPSKPYENPALKKAAETWSGDFWKLGGGGSVWDGMAYDPDADLLYVGTGNGGPWPEALRKSKGKDNLYVCSVLAVKPDTGELKWYFQMVPGDSWDFDSVQQLLLADLTVRGQPRKVLMQANKNGFYYVIDRLTGQFISPGPGGAHNWSPMSFNPTTGLVYIPTSLVSSSTFAIDTEFSVKPGQSNIGIKRNGPPGAGPGGPPLPAKLPPPPGAGPEPPADGTRAALVAWDPVTQKQRWQTPGGGSIGGGTVTTAGNLVFQVIPDGRLVAYTADKGEKLLEIQTKLRGGMGPPITFQLDGKQYVAVAGGTGVVIARNAEPGAPPPAPTAQTVMPKLMVFELDGQPVP
jgi:quinohemoprotein ethanol dehydrogenase